MIRRSTLLPIVAVAALLGAPVTLARAGEGTVTVRGEGKAAAPADLLEIVLSVSASADEMADCRGRFDRRYEGLRAALAETAGGATDGGGEAEAGRPLAVEPVWGPEEIVPGGTGGAITPQQAAAIKRMGGNVPPNEKFTIRRLLTLRIAGIDALDAKARAAFDELIDGLVERGVDDGSGGEPPIFRYRHTDPGHLRAAALERAVGDARRQAEQLARLCGRGLGQAVKIRDVSGQRDDDASADASNSTNVYLAQQLARLGAKPGSAPEPGETAARVEVTREIEIEFALTAASPAAPEKD